MNAPLPRSAHPKKSAQLARANLARFDIHCDVPPSLAMLIIDVFDLLPEPDAKNFPANIAQVLQTGPDLSAVPSQFLLWLLTDPTHGLINLTRRDDVKQAIERVARYVVTPRMQGIDTGAQVVHTALLLAEVAQNDAWHAYQHAENMPYQARVDWMIASAAVDAALTGVPATLASATHSAAVAWTTEAEGVPGKSAQEFYRSVSAQLLVLLTQQPLHHRRGSDDIA